MSYPIIKPRKWDEFQHYKDRCPPWVKLHRGLLDDYDYSRLPIASKAIAPLLWLLASESKDGEIRLNKPAIAFRLHITEKELDQGLTPLIDSGFFILEQDASNMLAERKQDAIPETEGETETKREAKTESARKRAIPLPADFSVSERVKAWAAEKGHQNLDAHFEHFVGSCKARGAKYIDWDEALMNAIRGNWAKIGQAKPNGSRFPTYEERQETIRQQFLASIKDE